MAKIKAFKPRYDNGKANTGVWHTVIDEATGTYYGRYKMRLIDAMSEHFAAKLDQLRVKHDKPVKNGFRQPPKPSKEEAEAKARAVWHECVILLGMKDWDLEDENDKPVPFTEEAAIEFFDPNDLVCRWIIKDLFDFATNVANYQHEEIRDEVPEKN